MVHESRKDIYSHLPGASFPESNVKEWYIWDPYFISSYVNILIYAWIHFIYTYLYKGHLVGWFCRESCPFKTADRSGPCVVLTGDWNALKPCEFLSQSSHILALITSPISAEFCQTNVSIFSLQGKSAMNISEVCIYIYLRKQKVTDFSQRERWTCFTMTGSALIVGPSFFPGLNSGCLAARVLLVAHCFWKFLISFWIL